ncbi:MAG: SRPBCC family protein [Actinomycetota bacterium]|nr:SRPBCC family protein [Actinomycetota bacterium]
MNATRSHSTDVEHEQRKYRLMPANSYRFDEYWWIPGASPEEVYGTISQVRLLPEWWKGVYLEAEPLDGAAEPYVGARARVKARGRLPYELNFVFETTALQPGRLVEVRTIGDFVGVWRATLSSEPGGTRVDIDWRVVVEKPLIRSLSPLLKPLFAWNHNWTTPRGEAGLRSYLRERGGSRADGSGVVAAGYPDCKRKLVPQPVPILDAWQLENPRRTRADALDLGR